MARVAELAAFLSMTPYIITFAAVFGIASYGLHRRTLWAWWCGWVVFFLVAGYFGLYSYSALYSAETSSEMLLAAACIAGGAVLWVPAAVWWCGRRSYFGRRPGAPLNRTEDGIRKA
jgi:hypothetical protein